MFEWLWPASGFERLHSEVAEGLRNQYEVMEWEKALAIRERGTSRTPLLLDHNIHVDLYLIS